MAQTPRVTYNRESVSGVTENMVTVAQALPISGRRDLELPLQSEASAAAAFAHAPLEATGIPARYGSALLQ
jgi:hypothetical protein